MQHHPKWRGLPPGRLRPRPREQSHPALPRLNPQQVGSTRHSITSPNRAVTTPLARQDGEQLLTASYPVWKDVPAPRAIGLDILLRDASPSPRNEDLAGTPHAAAVVGREPRSDTHWRGVQRFVRIRRIWRGTYIPRSCWRRAFFSHRIAAALMEVRVPPRFCARAPGAYLLYLSPQWCTHRLHIPLEFSRACAVGIA